MIAIILITFACSRPVNVPNENTSEGTSQAPFQAPGANSNSDAGPSLAIPEPGVNPQSSLPFHDGDKLPAGTLLTVRLREAVTAGTQGATEPFEAVVDQAVVIDGNTVVPSGASVVGRVESARVSKIKPDRGYVRLALESIRVKGSDVPLQTASLFARQNSRADLSAGAVRLEKGRRLTFRLTEAVSLNLPRTQASR